MKMFPKITILLFILRKMTISKLINLSALYFQYFFSRKQLHFTTSVKPSFLSIEPADFCQLGCPECPVGASGRNSGTKIEPELFHKIIDQLHKELIYLNLFFQGEPLLNKKLPELIRYANSKNIFTALSTNAQLLNGEQAKALVESGLGKIIISIDGTTQEVYENYRRGGKLQNVTEAIKHLNEWKRKLHSHTPFIEMQFIVFKTNEHQINDVKRLAKSLHANQLTLKSAQIYDLENGKDILTSINKYARYNITPEGKLTIKSQMKNKCWRQWSGAVLNAKGEVLPCCFDKNSAFSFGNINNAPFAEIWHNKSSDTFRKNILSDRKKYEMCRNCTTK